VVVAVLFSAGDQDPVMPFVEVVGKAAKAAPEQIAGTAAKVGITKGFTVIGTLMGVPTQPAAVGVTE
jgi:hypothetical protein